MEHHQRRLIVTDGLLFPRTEVDGVPITSPTRGKNGEVPKFLHVDSMYSILAPHGGTGTLHRRKRKRPTNNTRLLHEIYADERTIEEICREENHGGVVFAESSISSSKETASAGARTHALATPRRSSFFSDSLASGGIHEQSSFQSRIDNDNENEQQMMAAALGLTLEELEMLEGGGGNNAQIQDEARQKYLEAFQKFDTDGSGDISPDELRAALHSMEENMPEDELEAIVCQADADGDGSINYDEFLRMFAARKRVLVMAGALSSAIGKAKSGTSASASQQRKVLPPLKLPARGGGNTGSRAWKQGQAHRRGGGVGDTTFKALQKQRARNGKVAAAYGRINNQSGVLNSMSLVGAKRARHITAIDNEGKEAGESKDDDDKQDESSVVAARDLFQRMLTPHCLQPGAQVDRRALRRELEVSKHTVTLIDSQVRKHIEWVQDNCNVTSLKAQLYCKRWGAQKLANLFKRIEHSFIIGAWGRWDAFVEHKRNQEKANKYMQYKASRRLGALAANWQRKQIISAWNSWQQSCAAQVYTEEQAAVRQIQRIVRGKLGKLGAVRQWLSICAVKLQRIARGYLSRCRVNRIREHNQQVKAALCVQRAWRNHSRRKLEAAALYHYEKIRASNVIQSAWRGYLGRKVGKAVAKSFMRDRCAIEIQRVIRGHLGRMRHMEIKYWHVRHYAATKLQSLFRGAKGRAIGRRKLRELLENVATNEAALKIECMIRVTFSRVRVGLLREEKRLIREKTSANLIQKTWKLNRGDYAQRKVRRQLRHSAATTIQRIMRGVLAREEVIMLRYENAANVASTIEKVGTLKALDREIEQIYGALPIWEENGTNLSQIDEAPRTVLEPVYFGQEAKVTSVMDISSDENQIEREPNKSEMIADDTNMDVARGEDRELRDSIVAATATTAAAKNVVAAAFAAATGTATPAPVDSIDGVSASAAAAVADIVAAAVATIVRAPVFLEHGVERAQDPDDTNRQTANDCEYIEEEEEKHIKDDVVLGNEKVCVSEVSNTEKTRRELQYQQHQEEVEEEQQKQQQQQKVFESEGKQVEEEEEQQKQQQPQVQDAQNRSSEQQEQDETEKNGDETSMNDISVEESTSDIRIQSDVKIDQADDMFESIVHELDKEISEPHDIQDGGLEIQDGFFETVVATNGEGQVAREHERDDVNVPTRDSQRRSTNLIEGKGGLDVNQEEREVYVNKDVNEKKEGEEEEKQQQQKQGVEKEEQEGKEGKEQEQENQRVSVSKNFESVVGDRESKQSSDQNTVPLPTKQEFEAPPAQPQSEMYQRQQQNVSTLLDKNNETSETQVEDIEYIVPEFPRQSSEKEEQKEERVEQKEEQVEQKEEEMIKKDIRVLPGVLEVSAKDIQRLARGRQARVRVGKHRHEQRLAMVEEQRLFHEEMNRQEAVLSIQCALRKYKAVQDSAARREELDEKKKQVERERTAAILIIQKASRVAKARTVVSELRIQRDEAFANQENEVAIQLEREAAAVQIQSIARGVHDRQLVHAILDAKRLAIQEEMIENQREEAAILIQSACRTKMARNRVNVLRKERVDAALARQAALQARQELEERTHEVKEMSATQIQAFIRVRAAKNEAQRRREEKRIEDIELAKKQKRRAQELAKNESATKIQCMFRSIESRRIMEVRRNENEIRLVQLRADKIQRDLLDIVRQEQQIELSAIKIQGLYRNKIARSRITKLRKEHRRKMALEERERIRKAKYVVAVKLQAAFRGSRDRTIVFGLRKAIEDQRVAREHAAKLQRQQEQALMAQQQQMFQQTQLLAQQQPMIMGMGMNGMGGMGGYMQQPQQFGGYGQQQQFGYQQQQQQQPMYAQQQGYQQPQQAYEEAPAPGGGGAESGGDWIEYYDEASQAYYYWHSGTNETRWDDPRLQGTEKGGGVGGEWDAYETPSANASAGQGEAAAQDDYGDWEQYYDDSSQRNYWYNASTGETRWA